MKKIFTLIIFLTCVHQFSIAQYADRGTGLLRNEIWWFDWAGLNMSNGASKTFVTADGLTVTIVFSNVSFPALTPMIMNTWNGAVLHELYDFTNTGILPALWNRSLTPAQNTFTMQLTATRNGNPVPCTFIAADAEASNLSEVTTLTTNGSNWQTVDFYRSPLSQQTNPLTGCNTQTVVIADTYGGSALQGQNPVVSTTTTTGSLQVDVLLDHRALGSMAVAFGIMAPIDRGDLPASYGTVQHEVKYTINNGCNFLPPLPAASKSQLLKLGAQAGDADATESADDNANGVDEDGVTTFPVYLNAGVYSVQANLNNTTGSDAYLTGWFDFNRNGVFDNGESTTVTVPNNATAATLTWTGLPTWLTPGTVTDYSFRFRLSSDMTATQSATGFAKDGEVEDYIVPVNTLCNISIQTINDSYVCAAQPVTLTTTGTSVTSYSWDVPTFLNDAAIASPVSTPTSDITYTITGSNPQGCEAKDAVTLTLRTFNFQSSPASTTMCASHSATLNASGGDEYTWLAPDNSVIGRTASITVQPATTQIYRVVIKENTCNTSATHSIPVQIVPSLITPVVTKGNDVNCTVKQTTLQASGGTSYLWDAGPGLNAGDRTLPNPVVTPTQTTTYYVYVDDNNNCPARDSITVMVDTRLPAPVLTKSNDIDCSTAQATLRATGGVSYQWAAAPGIENTNSPSPVVKPQQTTTYVVTVTDSKGCSIQDSITVLAGFTKDLNRLPVPSAFTPNNDGRNDCFGLKSWGPVTQLQFQVFNRWGERVFSATDASQCWDGTYKGVQQPAGGYAYIIKAVTPCGSVNRSGMVMLVR